MKTRAVASVLLAASLTIGLSACNFFSPQATLKKYDPSDGVGANLGDVDVRNVLLITEDGTRATLVMSVVNTGADAQSLEVEYESSSDEAVSGRVSFDVEVPGQSVVTTSAGEDDQQIVLEDIDAPAGSLFSVFVQSGDAQGVELRVPVLDTTLSEYDALQPTPQSTPTPTPTIVSTPIPTPTVGTEPEAPLTEPETGPEVDTTE